MEKEQLLKNIDASNLPENDKLALRQLLKQKRYDEYIKLIVKIIGLGSVFWD
jgi:hypothetical protein